ncbi:hypothetical protein BDV96DRAFT_593354 [Lophiotrema nucula]|uniref:DUF1754-domain-containing protein n=1 Tax=Lophiotrema nucula TaxID=690887 RepID=A0A6A5ZT40_9PLEO|nr:hypothetical protein BDV96DRAFT_593354 [Lophiotrema nucula]
MAGDYTATGGGLKFKGSGVDKKKKKKKPKSTTDEASSSTDVAATKPSSADEPKSPSKAFARSLSPETAEILIKESGGRQKTEAEKRHEEMRKKRLEERLKREGGVKTHKERVEELNRYLSGLSEHHDMPKIGPG